MTTPSQHRNSVWDDNPEGYNALREKQGWLNQRRALYLHDWLARFAPTGHILELGSGHGQLAIQLTQKLPQLQWTGIDPLPAYIAYAQAKAKTHRLESRIRFLQGQAEQLHDLALPRPFDAIVSSDVLHHIDDVERALEAAAQVAKKNAQWCAIEPNALNPYAGFNQWRKPGERNFWPQPFLRAAKHAGWDLIERRYIFLIPPWIPNPGNGLKKIESKLEGIPFLGGGVALTLRRRG